MSGRSGRHTVLPGFRVTMGFTMFYLCLIVLLPLLTVPTRAASLGWVRFLARHHGSARGRVVPDRRSARRSSPRA